MKKVFTLSVLYLSIVLLTPMFAQVSPFGTGKIDDIYIGEIENLSVIEDSKSGYAGYYTRDINNYLVETETAGKNTFDLYIPASYDGSEPYGLMTWISSGTNGIIRNAWKKVADEKKIIFIGANMLGNNEPTTYRIRTAVASAFRMREIFNIDENRIYASGNSGGARVAANMAYLYPEWIAGSLCLCGSSYFNNVERGYETREGDYEKILNYDADYKEYVKTFNQRYAIMTSYDDFREGNIMNIYHNGMEPDGFRGKMLETEGTHCATNTTQFRDAVNFVEHSFRVTIDDEFNSSLPTIGTGYILDNATIGAGHLNLSSTKNKAQLKTRDLFYWDDPKGIIFRTRVVPNNSIDLDNTVFNLGIWEYTTEESYFDLDGASDNNGVAGIVFTADYSDAGTKITVKTSNSNNSSTSETIFTGTLDKPEGVAVEELKIKYFLWNNELRIELSSHFTLGSTTMVDGVKLLDDNRSIRIVWDEMNASGYWSDTQWVDGAFMTMTSSKLDYNLDSEDVLVEGVSLISDELSKSVTLSNSEVGLNTERVSIYPNITSDILSVSFNGVSNNEELMLDIYSSSGQILRSISLKMKEQVINISDLDNGVYIFKMYNSSFSEYKRIIKK